MKKSSVIIFILLSNFCFAQSDYIVVEKKVEDLSYYNDENVKSYDSIKNITTVNIYNVGTIFLIGKWNDFNKQKYLEERLITHCPVLINENNFILEIGIFDQEINQILTGRINFKKYNFAFLRQNKRMKSKILTSVFNKEKNYYLHKIKHRSLYNDASFFTSYHLIGKKGKDFYRMVLYNNDETNFENFEEFLINTYNNN
ncbi:hypothetical protein [Flavobacterium sp.]|uniref:hypothetical protein n=1 Tax=Flavobacterium sp. TaxID=239 RepID=UPI00375232CB